MRLWREESFGPVKAIIRVHSEEEALAVANDSEYGLFRCGHSRDSARAWNVAQRRIPGFAISMAQRCMMRRKCRLAAAKPPAMAALAGGPGSRIHRAALDNDPDPAPRASLLRPSAS